MTPLRTRLRKLLRDDAGLGYRRQPSRYTSADRRLAKSGRETGLRRYRRAPAWPVSAWASSLPVGLIAALPACEVVTRAAIGASTGTEQASAVHLSVIPHPAPQAEECQGHGRLSNRQQCDLSHKTASSPGGHARH